MATFCDWRARCQTFVVIHSRHFTEPHQRMMTDAFPFKNNPVFARACDVCFRGFVFALLILTTGCSHAGRDAFPDPKAAKVADAILDDNGAKVAELIRNGADVNAVGKDGRSLLEFAVWQEKYSAFQALLNSGADTAHRDAQGETVLHYATVPMSPAYVTDLLARHVDPNVLTPGNRSALMMAAEFNRRPHLKALIAAGANLEFAESNGDTALIMAAEAESLDTVIDLLHAGANPFAGHRIQGKPDTTFQGFLNLASENAMSAEAKQKRAEINAWLRAHNIPVEPRPKD
jgi:uncharacterized protein